MSDSSSSSGGVGIATVLVIVFAVLKLAEVDPFTTWSWWLVFLPWIISAAIGFVLIILALILT
jgi:hypothetical protein